MSAIHLLMTALMSAMGCIMIKHRPKNAMASLCLTQIHNSKSNACMYIIMLLYKQMQCVATKYILNMYRFCMQFIYWGWHPRAKWGALWSNTSAMGCIVINYVGPAGERVVCLTPFTKMNLMLAYFWCYDTIQTDAMCRYKIYCEYIQILPSDRHTSVS